MGEHRSHRTTSAVLDGLDVPVVSAPMAGGPSTPQLAAAVSSTGGLGFLAAGYLTTERVAAQLDAVRALTDRPFGLNVFAAAETVVDTAAVEAYARVLRPMAHAAGVELGTPRADDDELHTKIELAVAKRIPVVSFTFGLPETGHLDALHGVGAEVWVTVTSADEARRAADAGADVLVVQGIEAGGHRGTFVDDEEQSDLTLLVALELISHDVELPLVAAGGVMTGAALAGVLAAGARAGQLGTAYLRSDEAGTSPVHRAAIGSSTPTVLTRAFSGRLARGVTNAWHESYGALAPSAYPHVHHLTVPLRARGRESGDPDLVNLWAGQGHALTTTGSAAEITLRIFGEARAAAHRTVSSPSSPR